MARSSEPRYTVLADVDGRLHHLIEPAITSGGQGDVYRTREPNIGVKVLRGPSRAVDIIRDVRRLPIEDLTSIAAPLSTLLEYPGYMMLWLRGMVSLGQDRLPPSGRLPEIMSWYIGTGGLRRRLALTAKLAEVIADLHGRGLVYVDLSMANVMVSETGAAAEVRLIDLDNLRVATDKSPSVLTPRWAAPELFEQSPPSRHTDCYSLALVSFATLTGYHPFEDGGLVRPTPDGSPQRWAAVKGNVPSFIDVDDTSNATERHLFPIDVLLTPTLLAAYRRTFGPGRHDPGVRPTAAQWRRWLWDAFDRTVTCDCGFSSYLDPAGCVACGRTLRNVLTVEVRAPDASAPSARISVSGESLPILQRHLPLPTEPRQRHDEVVRMSPAHGAITLSPVPGWSCSAPAVQAGGEVFLERDNGTRLLLRAVPHAS